MLGEFQSMAFTSPALCAFCAATNFVKRARASVSFAAADASPPDATVTARKRSAAATARWRRQRADSIAESIEFVEWVTLTSLGFSAGLGRRRGPGGDPSFGSGRKCNLAAKQPAQGRLLARVGVNAEEKRPTLNYRRHPHTARTRDRCDRCRIRIRLRNSPGRQPGFGTRALHGAGAAARRRPARPRSMQPTRGWPQWPFWH